MNKYLIFLCAALSASIAQAMDGDPQEEKQTFLSKMANRFRRKNDIDPIVVREGRELLDAIEASNKAWEEYQYALDYEKHLFEELKKQRTTANQNSPEIVRLIQAWEAAKTVTATKSAQYDGKRRENAQLKEKLGY